jgi:hypothetical protein
MKIRRRPSKLKAQGSPATEAETHVEKKKTTTITSESHELFIVRRGAEHSIRMWCPDCAAEVDMLKPEEAAAIANVTTRTIYRWIEAAQIHHNESRGGNVLVCPKCLWRRRAL